MSYKYDPKTGEAMYDPKTGEPIPEDVTPTYKEQAPGLRDKVKALGFSGLDDSDKALFKAQYPHSQASKSMSFDEVVRYVDDAANPKDNRAIHEKSGRDVIGDMPTSPYDAVRHALSIPAGVITGTWNRFVGADGNIGSDKSIVKEIDKSIDVAKEGKGAAGLISDPLNLTMALPGVGELILGSKLAQGSKIIASNPKIAGTVIRGAGSAAEGGALGAGSAYMEDRDVGTAAKYGALLGGGLGTIASGMKALDRSSRDQLMEEALRKFPGQTFANREAVKSALELGSNFFGDKEKAEILAEVARIAKEKGIQPDYNAWYDLYDKLGADVRSAYKAGETIAEAHPRTEFETDIPTEELIDEMRNKLGERVGPYSNKDAERFLNKKMSGWVERFGEDGEIPIRNMGMIKSSFNQDIFDPRSITKNRENKIKMAKIAGEVLKEYMDKHKAFLTVDDMLRLYNASQNGRLSQFGITPEELGEKAIEDIRPVSFNELVERTTPGTKKKFIQKERLEDVFEHQRIPVGSERVGKGLFGKMFEGATHTYRPSGDAYLDPVMMFTKSTSKFPSLYQGIGGTFDAARRLRTGERQ